jgi:protein-S-isoprenylcysteine O-methyltransferase Ste14
MSKSLINRIPFAKILVVLAVVFVLSLGTCGLTASLSSNSGSQENGYVVMMIAGLAGTLLSGFGLLITTIVWVIAAATGSFSRKDSEPQRLLDEKDDKDPKG